MKPILLEALAVWVHRAKKSPIKGRILLIHGLSEHSGRHQGTIDFLTKQGWEVVRFDLRGAGRSGGRRQWVKKFEDYVKDTTQVYNWIQQTQKPLPLFILGHSLGGTIAIHFSAIYDKELAGLILSAPAFQIGKNISPLTIQVGKMLAPMTPLLRLPSRTSQWISRDPKVVEAFDKDPLACHKSTLQLGSEILRALEEVPDKCEQIFSPALLVHGTHDRIVPPEGSFEILASLSAEDRTLHLLPGGYHEPHNDLDKTHYFSLIQHWLKQRIQRQVKRIKKTSQRKSTKKRKPRKRLAA